MDYIASNVLLLVGALMTSVFVGWRVSHDIVEEQLAESALRSRRAVVWLLRYVCPLAILAVLVAGLSG